MSLKLKFTEKRNQKYLTSLTDRISSLMFILFYFLQRMVLLFPLCSSITMFIRVPFFPKQFASHQQFPFWRQLWLLFTWIHVNVFGVIIKCIHNLFECGKTRPCLLGKTIFRVDLLLMSNFRIRKHMQTHIFKHLALANSFVHLPHCVLFVCLFARGLRKVKMPTMSD